MRKKLLFLLLVLIMPVLVLAGCGKSESAFQASCTIITEVSYVRIKDQYQNGWTTYNNVDKIELRNDSGVAYVYLNDIVIVTSLENLVIRYKK